MTPPHSALAASCLPARWRGRPVFTVLDFNFDGDTLMRTLHRWRHDPHRCQRLCFVAITSSLPTKAGLNIGPHADNIAPPASTVAADARELLAQWPPAMPGIHRLQLAGGAITLDLIVADIDEALRAWVGSADVVLLAHTPHQQAATGWLPSMAKGLSRVMADDAIAITSGTPAPNGGDPWRQGLELAGFDAPRAVDNEGLAVVVDDNSQLRIAHRRKLPEGRLRHDVLTRLGPRRSGSTVDALIIGAGLAGAFVAAALSARGLRCTVLDRHDTVAQEASGGDAGIFHGTVHAGDNPHARLHRSASLAAARAYRTLIDHRDGCGITVPASLHGLLRVSNTSIASMRARVAQNALPADWVQALDAAAASERAGVAITHPCWLFPHAGWISPRALVQHLLSQAPIHFVGGCNVARIERNISDGSWAAFDPADRLIAQASTLVLANAAQASLLAPWAQWQIQSSRGQSTVVPAGTPGLAAPRMPVSSMGYALTLPDGSVLCGASAHPDDDAPDARASDTHDDLDKLARLTGSRPANTATRDRARLDVATQDRVGIEVATQDRVAWRSTTPDRMPIVGAVPARSPRRGSGAPSVPVRHVAREPGLYVMTGLGSRGLTLAPLMAEVVAASVLREPVPVEASILDAIDAARFVAKASTPG